MPFPSAWMARCALIGFVAFLAACSGDDAVADGDGGADSGTAQDGGGSGAGGGGTGGRDGSIGTGGSGSDRDGGGGGTGGSGQGGSGGGGRDGGGGTGGSGQGGTGGTGGTGGSGSGDDAKDDSVCDGKDGDGDGDVDEGYDVTTTDCGRGECKRTGELKCVGGDEVDSCKAATPGSSDASCNGEDDDCDGDTDEAYVPVDCDGEDDDECEEGETFCDDGEVLCDDASSDTKDVCNDLDDDCDSASADGSEDPLKDDACDGTDGDLCDEGTLSCLSGDLVCSDDSSNDLDVCNGEDDDCDAITDDGDEDPQLDDACDGTDSDLCTTGGTLSCGVIDTTVTLVCSDDSTSLLDLCGGGDEDCDSSSADGSEQSGFGDTCDGDDSDLCIGGIRVCSGTSLVCNDDGASLVDLCGGGDEDCDTASADGSEDPALSTPTTTPCDGSDDDECDEGFYTSCAGGEFVCSDPNDVDPDVDCGGDDEDCDGTNDEGYVADDSCGVGYCHTTNAQSTCVGGAETACDPGDPLASDATCDRVDDDCSGAPDEDYVNQSCGQGACLAGSTPSSCALGVETACVPGAQTGVSETLCNGVDDDCDGDTDENFAITCSGDLSGTLDCVDGSPVSTACDPSPADCLVYTCNIATVTCESTPNDALCDPDIFDCTTSACVITGDIGVCTQVPDDQVCQAEDGDACNGLETCEPGQGCAGGTPPCSDDDFSCTDTACTPLPSGSVMCSQQVVHTRCDNAEFCDGAETCSPASPTANPDTGCIDGPVCPGVEDGATCTEVDCDEDIDECSNQPIVGACSDSNNCTDNVCAPGTSGANPVTGCKFPAKDCSGAFPPHDCATSVCRSADGACVLDPDDSQCTFPQTCTIADGCASCTDDGMCSDGDPCNGVETCNGGSCQAGTPVTCTGDAYSCSIEQCNPGTGICETVLDHDACDDGVCNGADSCAPGAGADVGTGCAHGAALDCDDGAACTDDDCDPEIGCINDDSGLCEASDTTVCNGEATCQPDDPSNDSNGCVEPFPNGIQCEQDGLACTVAECVEPTGCREVPDNSVCGCGDVCVPGLGCDATCVPATCNGKTYACGDCVDNDNDCVNDPNDPNSGVDTGSDLNCLGPCQDNEAGLAGLIPGQNNAPCKMDCYFDADSGSGNDGCEWDHSCDPNLPGDQVKCDTYDDVTLIGGNPKVYCWGGASGTGDSFQLAGGGFIRLVDAAGLFVAGDVGLRITILGATSPANDGTYTITSLISATTIVIANPNGVNQAFTGTWNIAEANSGFEDQPAACYDVLDLRDNETGLCCDARESGAAEGSCTNGTDNDGDNLIDAADPDCNVCRTVVTCDGEDDTASGYCGPLVPNGCDCFGCCLIPGMNYPIYLGSTQLNGDQLCTLDTLSDPTKCRECVQVPGCLNTCATCEICVGKTTLPPECGECQECSPGVALCGGPCGTSCDPGFYCNTGCCSPVPQ